MFIEHGNKHFSSNCFLYVVTIFILITLIVIAFLVGVAACNNNNNNNNNNNYTVELNPKVLCPAQSVADSDALANSLTVDIPPGAAITKIYASMKQSTDAPINNAFISINDNVTNDELFTIAINKNPNDVVGLFETTLVQPFCIGENGAKITILPLNLNTSVVAESLDITVIYCPDYCTE